MYELSGGDIVLVSYFKRMDAAKKQHDFDGNSAQNEFFQDRYRIIMIDCACAGVRNSKCMPVVRCRTCEPIQILSVPSLLNLELPE